MYRKLRRSVAALTIVCIVVGMCLAGGAFANGVTGVAVSPPDQTVAKWQAFNVDVVISPAVPVAGAQCSLSFDPSLLAANSVTKGNLFGGFTTFFSPGTIDNAAGTISSIWAAILQQGGSVAAPGTFVRVNFTAKTTPGTSPVVLSKVIVGDTEAKAVPVNATNGSVTVHVTYELAVSANPFDGGTASGGGVYDSGTYAPVSAAPADECWHFVNWTGPVTDPASPSTTVYMDGDRAAIANFAKYQYTLTVGSSPPEAGTVTGDGTYDCGTDAPVAASPNDGYYFVNWSGDVADPNSPSTTAHMDASKAVTANFAQCSDYDVNCDGCVSVLDVVVIGQHMDETGPPGWIRADVNRDGLISVLDIIPVGQHFGEGCSS